MKLIVLATLFFTLVGCLESKNSSKPRQQPMCGMKSMSCGIQAPPMWFLDKDYIVWGTPTKFSLSVDGQEIMNECAPLDNEVVAVRLTSSMRLTIHIPIDFKPAANKASIELMNCDLNTVFYSNRNVQIKPLTSRSIHFRSFLN